MKNMSYLKHLLKILYIKEPQIGDFPGLGVVDQLVQVAEDPLEIERFKAGERLLMGFHQIALSRAASSYSTTDRWLTFKG